jgi:N-acetylglucosaminyl-diphospho-decaprenol L-rhamnosyltransferase
MNFSSYNKQLTIIVVTYHSNLIENLIKQINNKIKIIIIENSLDKNKKKYLEKKYKNIKVIIPPKNMGVGGGINIGLNATKTKYALHLSVDIKLDKKMIITLISSANKINNFIVLAPREKKIKYPKNIFCNLVKKNNFHKIKLIAGYALLFNMSKLKKVGLFDEKIFLYFEEHDFFYRCRKKNLNIYLIDKANVKHIGQSSINKKYNHEININRCWHYCWSKFYFYRKHYGYFYGLSKTFPNLVRSIKYFIKYTLKNNTKQSSLHFAEIKGLLSSYIFMKSSYRPSINE